MQHLTNSPYKPQKGARSQSIGKGAIAKSTPTLVSKLTPKKSEPKANINKQLPLFAVVGSALKPTRSSACVSPRIEADSRAGTKPIAGSLPSLQEIFGKKMHESYEKEESVTQNDLVQREIVSVESSSLIMAEPIQQPDNQQSPSTAVEISQPGTADSLPKIDEKDVVEELSPSLRANDAMSSEDEKPGERFEHPLIKKILDQTESTINGEGSEDVHSVNEHKHHIDDGYMLDPDFRELYEKEFYKKGYLSIKTQGLFTGWQKQYFEIEPFKIYFNQYKEIVEARRDIRCVNLRLNPCHIIDHKEQEFSIATEDQLFNIRLKGNTQEEADEWIQFFTKVFDHIKAKYPPNHRYTQSPEPLFKNDYMIEQEFLEKVDTGDFLLFRSKHLAAKLQRLFTSSDYDHCALCVRVEDEVYLYDSVIGDGVRLTSWTDFKDKNDYLGYTMISYRKLYVPTPRLLRKIKDKIWRFVMHHVGKKYELSVWKLFKRASFYNGGDDSEDDDKGKNERESDTSQFNSHDNSLMDNVMNPKGSKEPSRTTVAMPYRDSDEGFFCSELLAAAYKFTGLIDPSVSSSRYLPVSFSQKKDLSMRKGTSLSQEYILALITETSPNQESK